MSRCTFLSLFLSLGVMLYDLPAAPLPDSPSKAKDTLVSDLEPIADAAECLAGLRWEPSEFEVRAGASTGDSDKLLRFPSPVPSGEATNDEVALEWFMHRDAAGTPVKAPAIIVVHESGRGMTAGKAVARGLRLMGCHTFLLHMPGYGVRTTAIKDDMKRLFPGLRQAIADTRRARDAVASLPLVDSTRVGLCGVSLGGFVTATVLGLDRGYQHGFILLAGGHLKDVVLKGERDAATLRRQLRDAGLADTEIITAISTIEPLRLAHRTDAAKVWLFSASKDEVVPPACAADFAKAAGLSREHHLEYACGHYTAALYLPLIIRKMGEVMLDLPPLPDPSKQSLKTVAPVSK